MGDFPAGAHDRHLAGYRHYDVEVFCHTPDCVNAQGATVLYEEEYGQGWYSPEECPGCGGEWHETPLSEDEGAGG